MRKADTAARKARSRRNRHNGRINADKQFILDSERSQTFKTSAGRLYKALVSVTNVPNQIGINEDGTPVLGEPFKLVKSRIVRMPVTA